MNKFRIILFTSSNIVNLSKYHIDNILSVRMSYPGVIMMPIYGVKSHYNISTKILEILAEVKKDTEIIIEFYSKAESRDKLLNEILN